MVRRFLNSAIASSNMRYRCRRTGVQDGTQQFELELELELGVGRKHHLRTQLRVVRLKFRMTPVLDWKTPVLISEPIIISDRLTKLSLRL
jgi:hypothetical protein